MRIPLAKSFLFLSLSLSLSACLTETDEELDPLSADSKLSSEVSSSSEGTSSFEVSSSEKNLSSEPKESSSTPQVSSSSEILPFSSAINTVPMGWEDKFETPAELKELRWPLVGSTLSEAEQAAALILELKEFQKTWEKNRPSTYRFSVRRSCFCLPTPFPPTYIVHEGDSQSAHTEQNNPPLTISQFYSMAIELLEGVAMNIPENDTVVFDPKPNQLGSVVLRLDPKTGLVHSYSEDPYLMMADDEMGYTLQGYWLPKELLEVEFTSVKLYEHFECINSVGQQTPEAISSEELAKVDWYTLIREEEKKQLQCQGDDICGVTDDCKEAYLFEVNFNGTIKEFGYNNRIYRYSNTYNEQMKKVLQLIDPSRTFTP